MSKDPPARITQTYIENVALHYLERFASSSANLRRVLLRRIHRSIAHWGGEADQPLADLEQVMQKLTRLGYLDDARYAVSKAGWLRAKGGSTLKVRAGLAAKGVDKELIDQALSQLSEQDGNDDLSAAWILARRRRLGPYRQDKRQEHRDRDLAVLGRAGFSWGVAKEVVDSEDVKESSKP